VLTVTAVLWHGPTTTSYLAGFSIGTAAAATAGLLLLDTNVLRQQWNIRDLRRLLAFGLPLVPASLLELSLTLADRVIVAVFLDAFGLAAYAVAARVAGLAQLGVQSVTMALLPLSMQLLHRHERDEAGRLLGVVWRHLALIFFLGALAGTWLAPWIVALISPPAYGAAVAAIPYLMLAHVFQSFTYFTYIGTLKAERTTPAFHACCRIATLRCIDATHRNSQSRNHDRRHVHSKGDSGLR
jgi:O-antigen/teichoic acid export membrane protein